MGGRPFPAFVTWLTAVSLAACAPGPVAPAEPTTGGAPATTGMATVVPASTAAPAPPTTAAPPSSSTVPPVATRPVPPAGPAAALVTPGGVVVEVLGGGPGRWRVRTPCGAEAVVEEGRPVAAVAVLDPGHGGDERGATGPGGLEEAVVNLAVAEEAAAALERAGVAVALTRTADYRVTLRTRTALARALSARAFVSVHHNAEPDGPHAGPGSEAFYQRASADSRRLAGLVHEEAVAALSSYPADWVGDRDAGAKHRPNRRGGDYYGILGTGEAVPAVLAELAYLTNPSEAALLARPEVRRDEGEALARAVVRFLTTDDPGSGFVEPYPRAEPAGPGGGAAGCTDPSL